MNKPEEPLSRGFLLARGYCCHHNCKNCPYEAPNNRDCQLHYEPTDLQFKHPTMTTPTPQTDAAEYSIDDDCTVHKVVSSDFARKLEQELNEAWDKCLAYQKERDAKEKQANDCLRSLETVAQERNDYRLWWSSLLNQLAKQLNCATDSKAIGEKVEELKAELQQVLGSPTLRIAAEVASARNDDIAKLTAQNAELVKKLEGK